MTVTAPAGAALVARARAGDGRAFADLVRPYDDRLRRLVHRMLAGGDGVDDVLQETYVRAFRALGRFRAEADLGTWLYRIAHNCCVDELRSGNRRPRPTDEPFDPPARPGDDPGRRVPDQQSVRAALAALPLDQRAAVLLVDGDELDYSGAARVLGVPRGTVASRVARGREALRAALALALDEEGPR